MIITPHRRTRKNCIKIIKLVMFLATYRFTSRIIYMYVDVYLFHMDIEYAFVN